MQTSSRRGTLVRCWIGLEAAMPQASAKHHPRARSSVVAPGDDTLHRGHFGASCHGSSSTVHRGAGQCSRARARNLTWSSCVIRHWSMDAHDSMEQSGDGGPIRCPPGEPSWCPLIQFGSRSRRRRATPSCATLAKAPYRVNRTNVLRGATSAVIQTSSWPQKLSCGSRYFPAGRARRQAPARARQRPSGKDAGGRSDLGGRSAGADDGCQIGIGYGRARRAVLSYQPLSGESCHGSSGRSSAAPATAHAPTCWQESLWD